MRLWIESAHQSLAKAGAKVCGDAVRTLQTEGQFFVVLVSSSEGDGEGRAKTMPITDKAASLLEEGTPLERVVEILLAALPDGEHMPFSILQVETLQVSGDFRSLRAHLVECDAPPLFLSRVGRLVLLPVVEEVSQGHLIRECDFILQNGDQMAMVSEGYVHAPPLSLVGGGPGRGSWRWQDVAVSIGRWTETGCDAEQLLGALIRSYHRLAGGEPEDGWAEVPPVSHLEGVNLVTEGLVTLSKAGERMAGAKRVRDLPRQMDGATRLAQMLLTADRIHFIIGLAVNPEQAAGGAIPLRRIVIDDLMRDLEVHGKVVSVERF